MNQVSTQTNGGAMAGVNQGNFFQSYGDQVSQKNIVGTLLKFDKGDWLAGKENELIPVGTQLIANMDQLMVGWIRWQNGKPTDQIMGSVSNGYQPPKRNTLGDDDETQWERDDKTNVPKDPWSFSNYLLLQETEGKNDEQFTFATSSRGGLNAIGELCKTFGKSMRAKPNDYPVIELNVDSYVHTQYGRIKTPLLTLVKWAPKASFEVAGDSGDETETSASQQLRGGDDSGRTSQGQNTASPATAATKF